MTERNDELRERLQKLKSLVDGAIADLSTESVMIDNDREIARRVLGRFGAFDAVVVKAQDEMRHVAKEYGFSQLANLADDIDRVRQGIGGHP